MKLKTVFSFFILFTLMFISTACSHEHLSSEKDKQQVENETKLEKATPDNIKSAVFEALGFNSLEGEQKISDIKIDDEDQIMINFIPDANAGTSLLPFSIQKDIANILLGIKNSNVKVKSVQLISSQSSADQSGNINQKELVNVTYNNDTINEIDFESFNPENILSEADTVTYLDPIFER